MRARTPWVTLGENEAARQAADRARACVLSGRKRREVNPLFLHGPSGTGKSHLVADLADQIADGGQGVTVLPSAELADPREPTEAALVAVEDVQLLPRNAVEPLVALVDSCRARHVQLVCTAASGPAQLTTLPNRLTSRLASGLVVGLGLLGPDSRRQFLAAALAHRGQSAAPGVLDLLAARLPGTVRQLEGAVGRLQTLERVLGRAATLDEVHEAFREEQSDLNVERIVRQVGNYYRVDPRDLRSSSRTRQVLLPRQVSMYLARRLTALSLEQIGAFFGGRNHSTVLHACRKVEQGLDRDERLSRAVRELAAGLGPAIGGAVEKPSRT